MFASGIGHVSPRKSEAAGGRVLALVEGRVEMVTIAD
jgi:hypothetical protein